MNEEEKKAIERLEEQLNFWRKQNIKNSDCEIILNLITKLQKENEEKDNKVRKIIDRLDNDYKRITETKSDGNHWDNYSKCRLKAYRTKTREIKEYIEKQYFETKAKGE